MENVTSAALRQRRPAARGGPRSGSRASARPRATCATMAGDIAQHQTAAADDSIPFPTAHELFEEVRCARSAAASRVVGTNPGILRRVTRWRACLSLSNVPPSGRGNYETISHALGSLQFAGRCTELEQAAALAQYRGPRLHGIPRGEFRALLEDLDGCADADLHGRRGADVRTVASRSSWACSFLTPAIILPQSLLRASRTLPGRRRRTLLARRHLGHQQRRPHAQRDAAVRAYEAREFARADLNHDGVLDRDEFFLYYVSDICFRCPVGKHGHNPGAVLFNIFANYCSFGKAGRRSVEMDSNQLLRLCTDCGLVGRGRGCCRKADIDLIFHRTRFANVQAKVRACCCRSTATWGSLIAWKQLSRSVARRRPEARPSYSTRISCMR